MKLSAQRGVTLIEIMVAGGLLAFVLMASMGLLVGVNQATERVRRVGDTQEAARLALESLAADIRGAGMGAQLGSVGIAPAVGSVRRVPVIYSGPDLVVNENMDGGVPTSIVTNSIFIISGQPTTGVLSADGNGMVGTVTDAAVGSTLTVACSNGVGANVDCQDPSFVTPGGDDFRVLVPQAGGTFKPLIVGDFRNGVFLRPISLTSPSGTPPTQTMDFTERTANAFSPDPRAPFGFAPGAALQLARVVHYYLWPSADGTRYELRRSNPILANNAGNGACDATDTPFIDETNSSTGPVGSVIGSGPVESLQIRFVTDSNATDDPTQFVLGPVGVCNTAVMPYLREIRLQVVARSMVSDRDTGQGDKVANYSTPGFEGTTTSVPAARDAFPRRTFTINVVPRNLQGVRL